LKSGEVVFGEVLDLLSAAAVGEDPVVRLSAACGLAHGGQFEHAAEICRGVLVAAGGDEILLTAVMRTVDESGAELFSRCRGDLEKYSGGEYFDRLLQHAKR